MWGRGKKDIEIIGLKSHPLVTLSLGINLKLKINYVCVGYVGSQKSSRIKIKLSLDSCLYVCENTINIIFDKQTIIL